MYPLIFIFFQLKNLEIHEAKKIIRKTKDEVLRKVKESIMINEIVNEDFKKTTKSVKSSEKAVEVVNEMEKIIKSGKCSNMLAYQQGQIFENFQMNHNFIDMVKRCGISK